MSASARLQRSAACARTAMRCGQRLQQDLAVARAFCRASLGGRRDCGRDRTRADWFRRQPESKDRRSRPWCTELRPDSRYNRDNAYITANYSLSSDQFAVIVKTEKEGCLKYATLIEADRLTWTLQQVPGVQTTVALTNAVRQITAGTYEGSPKWLTIARNQDMLNYGAQQASATTPICLTPSVR